jgi:hypothetical protein
MKHSLIIDDLLLIVCGILFFSRWYRFVCAALTVAEGVLIHLAETVLCRQDMPGERVMDIFPEIPARPAIVS